MIMKKNIPQYENYYKKYLIKWMNSEFDYIYLDEKGFNISKIKNDDELYEKIAKNDILKLRLNNNSYTKNKEKKLFFDKIIKFELNKFLTCIKQFNTEDLIYIMYSILKYNYYISVNLQALQYCKLLENNDDIINILKSIIYKYGELDKVNAERIESFLAHHGNSIVFAISLCYKDLKKGVGNTKINNTKPSDKEIYEILEIGQVISYLEYMKYLVTNGIYKSSEINITVDGKIDICRIEKIITKGSTAYNYRYKMKNIEYTDKILEKWKEKFKNKFGFSYDELNKVMKIFYGMDNEMQFIGKRSEWIDFFVENKIERDVAIKIFDYFSKPLKEDTLEDSEIVENIAKGIKFQNRIFIPIHDKYIMNSMIAVYDIQYFINMIFNKPADYFDTPFVKEINNEFNLQVANIIKKEIPEIRVTTELQINNAKGETVEFDIIVAYGNKILIIESKRFGFEYGTSREKAINKSILEGMKQIDNELNVFVKNKEKFMTYLNKENFNFDLNNPNKYIINAVMLTKEVSQLHFQKDNKYKIFLYDQLIKFIQDDFIGNKTQLNAINYTLKQKIHYKYINVRNMISKFFRSFNS